MLRSCFDVAGGASCPKGNLSRPAIFLSQDMNKHLRTLSLTTLAAFAALVAGHTSSGQAKQITVMIDKGQVTFNDAQPQTIQGRIMVPLRGVFEKIGAYVEYDAANHKIHAHRQNESVDISLGDRIARKNGAEILMEVPATIMNGTAMVPLRFLAESMGAKVQYDQPSNTVTIITGGDGGVWHG